MNQDIDIEELARMIDSAVNSTNPSVKSALYSFLTMAALARAEQSGDEYIAGPFEQLFKRITELEHRLLKIEEEQYYNRAYRQSRNYPNPWDVPTSSKNNQWKYDTQSEEDILKYIGKLNIK